MKEKQTKFKVVRHFSDPVAEAASYV